MKRNILACIALATVLVFAVAPAVVALPTSPVSGLAQEPTSLPSYDQGTVELILAGVGGITVLGLTQLLKVWTKDKISPYILSAAVSMAATAFYLVKTGIFSWVTSAGYAVFVWASANGIYKATKT